jgi:flavin reductase (DIM6/NTAB) family NADH-FMN oxidoreductase RutF
MRSLACVTQPQVPEPFEGETATAQFRRSVGRFATGVLVVTTRVGNLDHAMTVNSFTSVSLDPMLVLVCIEREARFHDAVVDAGVWGVSVLDPSARAAAQWLSTRGRPLHGQLDRVPHHRGAATGVALVDQAVAWMECRTREVCAGGDHTVLIADVISAKTGNPEAGVLVYHRGRYGKLS